MESGRYTKYPASGAAIRVEGIGAAHVVGLSRPEDGNSRPDLVSSRSGRMLTSKIQIPFSCRSCLFFCTMVDHFLPHVLFVCSCRLTHRKCHPVSGNGPKFLPWVRRRRGRIRCGNVYVACMHNSSSTFEQKKEGTCRIDRTEARENALSSVAADGATLLSAARYDSCHEQQAWQKNLTLKMYPLLTCAGTLTRIPTEAT